MKYKCGSIVTEASGKLGGMVAMGKGQGGVFRTKPSNNKKNSNLLNTRRTRFVNIVNAWRTLSDANKALWLRYLPIYKEYGGVYLKDIYTPRELFLSCNLLNSISGSNIITTPVMPMYFPTPYISYVLGSVVGQYINFVGYSVNNSRILFVVFFSKECSFGCSSFKKSFTYTRGFQFSGSTIFNFWNYFYLRFGYYPKVGYRYFIKVIVVDQSSKIKLTEIFTHVDFTS